MKNYLTRRERDNDLGFNFFDSVFDDFFAPGFMVPRDSGMRTDIKETENGYELSVDMPGYDKKDISVELSHGYLTISAKREEKEENKKYLRRERSYSCSRSYYVGENIKREHVKAKYEGGTLHLAFPKEEKKEIPDKRIEIE